MSEPTVRPTSRLVLATALAGGVLAALVSYTALDRFWAVVPSPGPAGLWIGVLALLTWALAVVARRKIQREHVRVDPVLATRWLALGKTGALAGAVLTGFFAAWAGLSWPRFDTSAGRPRTLWSAAAAVAALVWCVAGAALERACRIPGPPDEEPPSDDPVAGPQAPA